MFEDILKSKNKDDEIVYYVCELSNTCQEEYCLHKHEHTRQGLGRPEQGDDEDPCDCSKIKCGKHGAVCIPV